MASIVLKNYTKNYGDFTAVRDLSIEVNGGEIVGFVGKNGAGKSTTLRAIIDLIRPTSGSITVDGMDSVKDTKSIKNKLSYIPSDAIFHEKVTAKDVFALCKKFSPVEDEKIENLCTYFELNVDKKISELSLGNRKKVSIIQAFLKDAEMYVMDEPTSGLDPLMQEKFFNLLLQKKNEGKCIFLSSHNLTEIEKYCDRVVIIKDGLLVDVMDMKSLEKMRVQRVKYETVDGEIVEFSFDGDVNELIQKLAKLKLKSLEIVPQNIDDEFIKYYKEGDEND